MDRLTLLLGYLTAIAEGAAAVLPDGTTPDEVAKAAATLARIASAAVKAHDRVAGEPLDVTKLHEIELVP